MTNKKDLVITDKTYDIAKPKEVVMMATILKNHIVGHKLYTTIVGKNYAHVEGWQFAGGLMGLLPKVTRITNLSSGNEYKWQAEVEIINQKNGQVVGTGFALCSNKENKKKTFDEYAVLSMAQTRAIGKAYRNILGWVMKLAGYEGTPSEEMVKMGETPKEEGPVTKTQPVSSTTTLKKGQVVGPNGKPVYLCAVGQEIITEAEYKFSMTRFKKALCREHQK